ncbi:MAG TPA: type II toxin-antitoxin system VapC family toxin [Terracidiphilus sp.]|nr:type II toxin-antitoxin system VapC family toxin [Terracidiphilus sp.]
MSCYFLETTAFARLFVREPGSDALVRLMESVEDNRRLIAASAPLEVHAAIRRMERAGGLSAADAAAALEMLNAEAARVVQEPLNPAVLETARRLLERTSLRWTETLQLAAALVARDMFPGTEILFVSASERMMEAARAEGFNVVDPASELAVRAAQQEASSHA